MKLYQRLGLTISLLLVAIFTFAQMVPPAPWAHSVTQKSVKVGDVIEVVFTVDIPKDWHIYANDFVCDPIKATFTYEENASFKVMGDAKAIGAHRYIDDIFECEVADFEKTGEFRQKIKILSANPTIVGSMNYQMCSNITGQCVQHDYDYELTGFTVASSGGQTTQPTPVPNRDQEVETSSADASLSASTVDSLILAKLEACCGADGQRVDPEGVVPAADVNYEEFKQAEGDTSTCEIKTYGAGQEEESQSFWTFFLLAFISGLAALLTPCVFPMIPMTVSFFMKDGSKAVARRNGLIYGLSIIGIYVFIGTLVAMTAGPAAANFLSTHWIPNVFFFLIFVIFAASFFGAFEITLPSWLVNKVDKQADKGGLAGIFFMAFTIVLVSFSCTGPIVGTILVQSAGGQFIKPLVGMLGFSLAFAIPFTLFAIFPSWLSGLPKSGGWLNSVKVILGFLELALGLKFLSVADQTYHWGILDREIYIGLWIVIFFLMGVYLLGKLKFAHDSDLPYLGVPRLMMAIITFAFVVYLIPGMWGAPLKALAGYMPPMSTHDFNIVEMLSDDGHEVDNSEEGEKVKYADKLHLPHGIQGYYDYEQGMEAARVQGKPAFIDFTGHGCVNCREMEATVWSDKRVLKLLKEEYIVISLYVDDKTIKLPENEWYVSKYSGKTIKTLAKKNGDIQACFFNANAQPQYALLDNHAEMLQPTKGYDLNADSYVEFLKMGLQEYKSQVIEVE